MTAKCKSKELFSDKEVKIVFSVDAEKNDGKNGLFFLYLPLEQQFLYEIGNEFHIEIIQKGSANDKKT